MTSLSHFVENTKTIQKLMYYKCHKASFKGGGSYIDSPNWMKIKKATKESRK